MARAAISPAVALAMSIACAGGLDEGQGDSALSGVASATGAGATDEGPTGKPPGSTGDADETDASPQTGAGAESTGGVDVADSGEPRPDLLCVEGTTFGSGVSCSADGTVCSKAIRVMSYNVHALPDILGGDNPKDRMRRIGEILAERRVAGTQPDFVLLQEAFDKADRIFDRAGYLSVVEGPSQNAGLDSGLYIMSDHMVVGEDRMSFDACAGTDCGAEKGVVAIDAQLADLPHPLKIITTHLQAQSENDDVRIEQIDELLPYLAQHDVDTQASVFAGDFNFKAKPDHDAHPSYVHFVEQTPYLSSGETCLAGASCVVTLDPAGKTTEDDVWLSTNDHHWHYASEVADFGIAVLAVALTFTEDFEGEPLSDHWAREFDYCVSWAA